MKIYKLTEQKLRNIIRIILEDQRKNITAKNLLNLPQEIAEFFHKIDPRNSYILAYIYKYFASPTIKLFSPEDNYISPKIKEWIPYIQKYQDISKKIQKLPNNPLNFNDLESIFEEYIPKCSKEERFMEFSDGSYWAWKNNCNITQKDYAHCGMDNFIYINKNNQLRISMNYNEFKNIVFEIKDFKNELPEKKYWPVIVAFFKKTGAQLQDEDLKNKPKHFKVSEQEINEFLKYLEEKGITNFSLISQNELMDIIKEHELFLSTKKIVGEQLFLKNKNLVNLQLIKNNLSKSYFDDCVIKDCRFFEIWFSNSNFEYINFNNSQFRYCNFENSIFNKCDFSGCDFRDCVFIGANFTNCIINNKTKGIPLSIIEKFNIKNIDAGKTIELDWGEQAFE